MLNKKRTSAFLATLQISGFVLMFKKLFRNTLINDEVLIKLARTHKFFSRIASFDDFFQRLDLERIIFKIRELSLKLCDYPYDIFRIKNLVAKLKLVNLKLKLPSLF